jgi:hypothetical protein
MQQRTIEPTLAQPGAMLARANEERARFAVECRFMSFAAAKEINDVLSDSIPLSRLAAKLSQRIYPRIRQ